MITPENDTVSWRDLADQLSEKQIAELEKLEQHPRGLIDLPASAHGVRGLRYQTPDELQDSLLLSARSYASHNLGAAMIGDVPAPAAYMTGTTPTTPTRSASLTSRRGRSQPHTQTSPSRCKACNTRMAA